MARPSNTDKLKQVRERVDKAVKWRKDEKYDDTWRRLTDLYRGKHFEEVYKNDDRIAVNISFSTVNVIFPSVTVNNPKITVTARKEEFADGAAIVEAIINYWWQVYKVKKEFRRATKDFLVMGHGWVKTGYRYTTKTVDRDPQVVQAEFDQRWTEVMAAYQEAAVAGDQAVLEMLPTEDEVWAEIPTKEEVADEDRPFAERVSPYDMFVDPDATSLEDARWIAQRLWVPYDKFKKDKRWNAEARSSAQPTRIGHGETAYRDSDERKKDREANYVQLWEYYDLAKGEWMVFTQDGDGFCLAPEKIPFPFPHPFVMLRNYDVPDFFYPIGDLENIEPLQNELNATRSQQINHRKRYRVAYMYKAGSLGADGLEALESDQHNGLIPVDEDVDLDDVIKAIPSSPVPPDAYTQADMAKADIDTVSGVSEYMRGGQSEIRRTATEAGIIADASNARAADKLAIIEEAIGEIASRLVQLAQRFLSGEHVARIVGPSGTPFWFSYTPEYIKGEFDFEVVGGSTQPNNESFRRQTAMQIMDALAPFLGTGILNEQEVVKHLLQEGFGVKNPDRFLNPMYMDPMMMQMMAMGDPAMGGQPAAPFPQEEMV
jgi:hypothetical protein